MVKSRHDGGIIFFEYSRGWLVRPESFFSSPLRKTEKRSFEPCKNYRMWNDANGVGAQTWSLDLGGFLNSLPLGSNLVLISGSRVHSIPGGILLGKMLWAYTMMLRVDASQKMPITLRILSTGLQTDRTSHYWRWSKVSPIYPPSIMIWEVDFLL